MVYIIIFLLTFWCHFRFDFSNKNAAVKRLLYLIEFILLVLVVALRYRVGGDSLGYEDDYESINGWEELISFNLTTSDEGFLWYAFVSLCQFFSSKWVFVQIIHALIFNYAVFRFVKKHCGTPFLAIALYAVFNYLYFNTEILRASLAVAVFLLWGYDALLKKQWVKYFILSLISANFHIEGVILLLFPIAYIIGKHRINEIALIFTLIGAVLLLNFLKIDEMLFSLAQYYEAFESRVVLYTVEEEKNLNWLIAKIIEFIPVFICLWGTKYLDKDPDELSLLRGLLVFYTVVTVLTIYFPALFSRLIDAIRIIYVVAFADTLGNMRRKHMNSLYVVILVVALFCGGFMQYRSNVINIKYYPYHSVLQPQKEPQRELLFTN